MINKFGLKKKTIILSVFLIAILIVGIVPLSMAGSSGKVSINTNSGNVPTSIAPKIAPKDASPRILVYADDAYHKAPNTYIDQALQKLALPYTAYYNGDLAGFNTALTSGGWDIVIFGHEEFGVPNATTYDNLNNYVNSGGKLIAESWNMGSFAGNALWTTMGVTWISDNTGSPNPVYWWIPSNPIVSGVPQFTSLTGSRYSIYGQYVQPLAGTTAIGGYTVGPSANNASLVLRNDGKTLFKGFMDGQNDADLNRNLIPDGVELWRNAIKYMIGGPSQQQMVFIRGSDNALWYRTYDGTNFGPWTSLGGVLSSEPEASTWFGKIVVFVRGSDNALWYRTYDGTSWSSWTSLGGVITSGAGAS